MNPKIPTLSQSRPDAILEAALSYADRGWHVIPLHGIVDGRCTCGDPECGKHSGKHPNPGRGWRKRATTDSHSIEEMFSEPNLNLGIVPKGDLLIVDVDAPGATSGRQLPMTPSSTTGRGHHLYYRGSARKKTAVIPKVDVVSDGGLVVAPPSAHLSGTSYRWCDYMSPDEIEVSDPPDWILDALEASEGLTDAKVGIRIDRDRILPTDLSTFESIPDGKRNSTLFSFGCELRQRGVHLPLIGSTLLSINERRCVPPLPQREIRELIHYVGRYQAGPIRIPRVLDPREQGPGGVAYGLWVARLATTDVDTIAESAGVTPRTVRNWRSDCHADEADLMDFRAESFVRVPESILDPGLSNPERRILLWMCWLSDDFGWFRVPQRSMADSLGIRRATISGQVKGLRDRGAIWMRYGPWLEEKRERIPSEYRIRGIN